MAFQVSDYHDLVRLLQQHPEWREELRHLLLTPDVLELPQAVRELVEAHKRAEERLTRLEQSVAELVEVQRQLAEEQRQLIEAHKRSEERLTRLEQTVAELSENQKRAEERLTRLEQTVAELVEGQRQLTEAQKKTEEKLQKLTDRVDLISIQVDELRGDMLEIRYRQRAFSYFGRIISRAQVVDLQEIWPDKIEPNLSEEERNDLLLLD
ncbi:MAG: hypothetical protein N3D16_09250, partial [Anaerolineales bacterium]|nr:hypothetical protein [Anaerolineales bacterium]